MKTRSTTNDLKQRISRLYHQKIEEEEFLQRIREKIEHPINRTKDRVIGREKRRFLPAPYHGPTSVS